MLCAEVSQLEAQLGSVAFFERVRNTAHIGFNHPDRPGYTDEYRVALSKNAPLSELKEKIAKELGLEASNLHLARAQKTPQLKDETKTIREVGLAGGSHCFVGHGAPCDVDEFMLRVAFYSAAEKAGSRAKDAFSHAGNGGATIRSLRESLVEPLLRWCDELKASGEPAPFESEGLQWRRLRLRDGQAGKHFAILRDDRTLRSALLGVADGRQVAVQILDHDESLTPADLVVQLRPWRYEEGRVFAATEWILRGSLSLAEIRAELNGRYRGLLESTPGPEPGAVDSSGEATAAVEAIEEDYLEIVALPSVGPPLSVQRCAGLRWAESPLSSTDAEELKRPITEFREVRDGCTLVLRSALRAKRGPPAESAKTGGEGQAKAGAKGLAKVKAKAGPKSGGVSVLAGPPRRERALIIEVAHPEGAVASESVEPNEDLEAAHAESAVLE